MWCTMVRAVWARLDATVKLLLYPTPACLMALLKWTTIALMYWMETFSAVIINIFRQTTSRSNCRTYWAYCTKNARWIEYTKNEEVYSLHIQCIKPFTRYVISYWQSRVLHWLATYDVLNVMYLFLSSTLKGTNC